MIIGQIDHNLEMRVTLKVASEEIDFLVDTGFNGYLAVPVTLVNRLGLQLGAVQLGITADGRQGFFDTVDVPVEWHDESMTLNAQILDEPLIGVRLLAGNELSAKWTPTGEFRIAPISDD